MAFISARDQEYLRQRFESELQEPVKLTLFVRPTMRLYLPGQEPDSSGETRKLLEELVSLSEKLSLDVHDVTAEPELARQYGIERTPVLVMGDETQRKGMVRFVGSPSGHEFVAVIEDIVDLSRGDPGLSEDTLGRLEAVTEPLHIQVFTTPT